MGGKKVVLVGMDIRKPRIAEYLSLPEQIGVTSFLASTDLKLNDIITPSPTTADNLDVIQSGIVPPNPSELLLSNRLIELFDQLPERYDYFVIDSTPIGIISDTLSIARVANITMFVTRLNVTTKSDLANAHTVLEEKRLPNMSVVVNGAANVKKIDDTYSSHETNKKHRFLGKRST